MIQNLIFLGLSLKFWRLVGISSGNWLHSANRWWTRTISTVSFSVKSVKLAVELVHRICCMISLFSTQFDHFHFHPTGGLRYHHINSRDCVFPYLKHLLLHIYMSWTIPLSFSFTLLSATAMNKTILEVAPQHSATFPVDQIRRKTFF